MFQRFLPFSLALIGLSVILFASFNRYFEWQVSEFVMDFPSSYEVRSFHSPWITLLGESLNDKSYVFTMIHVSKNGQACSVSDLSFVVKRSPSEEFLERLSLTRQFNTESISWLTGWLVIEIALSVAYILWFTIWHEHRPISHAIISAVFATMCFGFMMMLMAKLMGPSVPFFDGTANCHGTITFSAKLLKVYYAVPVRLFIGIFAQLTALVVMVRQIRRVATERKRSSRSAVG